MLLGAAATLMATGCSDPAVEADCEQQIEYGDARYTQAGSTQSRAEPFERVVLTPCHDTGESESEPSPEYRDAFVFPGQDPGEVLGLRDGRGWYAILLSDDLSNDQSDDILTSLNAR